MALTAKENQHNKSQPAGASAMTRSYSCHGCILYNVYYKKNEWEEGGLFFRNSRQNKAFYGNIAFLAGKFALFCDILAILGGF